MKSASVRFKTQFRAFPSLTAILALALTLLGSPFSLRPSPVFAAPNAPSAFSVNTTLDTPDLNTSDGICADLNGKCSLRAAILQANHLPGADSILLPAGIYTLTRPGHDGSGLNGSLTISESLTIQGAGSGAVILDGNGPITGDRVFQILPSAATVSLNGLRIRNGQAPAAGPNPLDGGAIYRDGSSAALPLPSLQLSDVVIESSSAANGGGLFALSGQLTLSGTRITQNSAANQGGGLYAAASTLTVQDSQVSGNSAATGGGFYLTDIADGQITRVDFFSNSASSSGGGLSNTASPANPDSLLIVQDSSFYNNTAALNGGALADTSSLTLLRSLLDHNAAGAFGGGLMLDQAGLESTVLIKRSTLSANSATSGGGIYHTDACCEASILALQNSTLSANTASHDGGGLFAGGSAHISLLNITLSANQILRPLPNTYPFHGAGFYNASPDTAVSAENTIIAGNTFSNGQDLPTPLDCSGALFSLGYNLIQDVTNCAISGSTLGNITALDPLLGALQNNGGPTPTHALLSGSPAIDAALAVDCFDIDQRGIVRPYNATGTVSPMCDLGAYEVSAHNSQSLLFGPLADQDQSASPLEISAAASSGLAVSFSSSTPAVCAVQALAVRRGITTAIVTFLHPGTCTLLAQQPGDATFDPAAPLSQSFKISSATYLPLVQH